MLRVRRTFVLGLVAYATGIAAWFVDLKACTLVSVILPAHGIPNPQLHAWWHVLVSIGFFLLLRVVSFDRSEPPASAEAEISRSNSGMGCAARGREASSGQGGELRLVAEQTMTVRRRSCPQGRTCIIDNNSSISEFFEIVS